MNMMTSPALALYLTCLFLGEMAQTTNLNFSSSVQQEIGFVSAKTREDLTLQCLYKGIVAARLYWYKQRLGEKPKVISTFYMYDKKKYFYGEFKNNSRFTLNTENGTNHLSIADLHISDAATYFCISCYLYTMDISVSITVSVQDSGFNVPALVHQSPSETIQAGDSMTLNCTVQTGTCDGQHSVYWFKDSEESHPGLIYTDGGRNDQCERKPDTQTHTCVYNLPMKSLNPSHAGTYYCAVASCGHILFGDGTKLDFEGELDSLVSVYLLSGALTFTTILSVLLALSVCMMNKTNSCQSIESNARFPAPSTANAKGCQNAEILYYAALSVHLHNGSRRQRDQTWSECVYYSVKQ
ncbi:uncharacterized protein [Cebidichthys violaceus]|uniref:uncharacterized protein isoform X2 n=1 Tax=Cebidichthys violaceus TaxID=271503 RepID=UPI0035CBEDFE